MNKILAIFLVFVCFMCAVISNVFAGEIDVLLEKLVEKGVVSGAEAQQIKIETQEKVKKEIATGKSASLPAWVQNIKLKGDLRLRYQYKHDKSYSVNDPRKDTNIGRVRMRLGLEAKINEKLMAGIGIATGDGDARSTNISFGSQNQKKEIRLDYAYAKYSFLPWATLVGGKTLVNDMFWEPTDLIWDTDITPEGGALVFKKDLSPETSLFMNTGMIIMDTESTTNGHPMMEYHVQPGITQKINDTISLKGALAFYAFYNVKDKTSSTSYPQKSRQTNTLVSSKWKYEYRMLTPALELSIKEPFKAVGLNVENLKLFGEYVDNIEVKNKNNGFSLVCQFGNEKVEKWGDWQFRYIYAMLEKDSVLDILPDSDRYSGKTGIRSHEGSFNFGLGKNTFLGLDIYRSWNIMYPATTTTRAPETLVQVDWNMKF